MEAKSYLKPLSLLLAFLHLFEAFILTYRANDVALQFLVYGLHAFAIGLFLANVRKTGSDIGSLTNVPIVFLVLSLPPILGNMAPMVKGFVGEAISSFASFLVVGLPFYLYTYKAKASESK